MMFINRCCPIDKPCLFICSGDVSTQYLFGFKVASPHSQEKALDALHKTLAREELDVAFRDALPFS